MSRTVAEVMTVPALTATEDESLSDAATRMASARVGSVVVVEGNRPVGILTERDLLLAAAGGAVPAVAKVFEWMTPDPECVSPDATIDDAWKQLSDRGYRHIPVVAGGEFKGIVSMRDLMVLSQLRPAEEDAVAFAGLKGVIVAETSLGDVRGDEGFYHYRQYAAPELATKKSFEEVWHLMFDGDLPDADELRTFHAEVATAQTLPPELAALLPSLAQSTTPFTGLRTALSHLAGLSHLPPSLDAGRSELRAHAMLMSAPVATIAAALHRLRSGLEPIEPLGDLGFAANYLFMLHGTEPSAEHARAIEQYLILALDHGLNASTFTARVVTSTGSDLGSAVVAAIGALSGPLHGGAIDRALAALDDIGSADRAADWVKAEIDKGPIMGFGHPVYRTPDPRSELLGSIATSIAGDRAAVAHDVKAEIERTLAALKPGRQPRANIEWFAAVVMEACGIPRDLFTPTFAVTRVIGWCAQALEQAADNRIIRPSARYIGPPAPSPVPGPASLS